MKSQLLSDGMRLYPNERAMYCITQRMRSSRVGRGQYDVIDSSKKRVLFDIHQDSIDDCLICHHLIDNLIYYDLLYQGLAR